MAAFQWHQIPGYELGRSEILPKIVINSPGATRARSKAGRVSYARDHRLSLRDIDSYRDQDWLAAIGRCDHH